MSDLIDQEPVPSSDKAQTEVPVQARDDVKTHSSRRETRWVAVFALVVFIGVGALYVLAPGINGLPQDEPSGLPAALTSRLDEIEARTRRVELGLERLTSATTTPMPQAQAPTEGQNTLTGSTEIEQLKAGLAGLSGALGILQSELEKTSKVTNEDRINMQAGLATMVAFFQMERVALNGQPFEKDRQILRKLADSDQTLVDKLVSLEPHALQGVATPMKLLKDWRMKSVDAQAALRKSGAQTWIDRIVVALEGLISIRSVVPGVSESLSFAGISLDLEEGNLHSAVQKAEALPPEVQETIKQWLDQAKARLAVETILSEMSTHLIERGSVSPPAPAEAVPAPMPDEAAQPATGGT